MTISLIACVSQYKGRLAIGRNNSLLVNLKEDMQFFKSVTSTSLSADSRLSKNVVVMGRKTWFSIPRTHRPLSDRINIVLTKDKSLHQLSPFPKTCECRLMASVDAFKENTYFMTFEQFLKFYKITNAHTFVIGGADIYNMFLRSDCVKPQKVYLTEVLDLKHSMELQPDTFMDHLDQTYKLISVSEKKYDTDFKVKFRFLTYRHVPDHQTQENTYLQLCQQVMRNGLLRTDRTGVGTVSIFGGQMHFDISTCIPLLTTKRIPWKHVIHELLWFLRGDTDAKILQSKGVRIWDGNTSREFLDSRGLTDYCEGILGPGYGWQFRFFGAKYSQVFADTSEIEPSKIGGFDQLQYVLHELKTNPYSRRIMMCYWNPPDFDKTALLPCHYSCQFYVRDDASGGKHLDCHFTMRSNDLFLGNPFNIFSYAVLTYILAMKCDMKPGKLVYTGGDIHIYNNHLQQIQEQLSRTPRPLPKLLLDNSIKYKDFADIDISDFEVVGYFPYPSIRADMAI